ncbi:MAG: DNA alkylation repair protein [Saprospirales bacterium]|nr:DNA alkylation repair protein [Saprospirales bacterium]
MNAKEYLEAAKTLFESHGDPQRAETQSKYMRNKFRYFGLKSAEWKSLAKQLYTRHGLLPPAELESFCRLAFAEEERELHYLAVQMLEKSMRKLSAGDIALIEYLITTKSWWDTVDWLAKLAGKHFSRFPELRLPMTEKWIASGNSWLQRTCIIFQLTYREKTDFDLMKKYILAVMPTKEFFLQKAAGWALRQYTKTNPDEVMDFLDQHPDLPKLTKKEAVKWLVARSQSS